MESGIMVDSLKLHSGFPQSMYTLGARGPVHKCTEAITAGGKENNPLLWTILQQLESDVTSLKILSEFSKYSSIQGQSKNLFYPSKLDVQVLEQLRSLLNQETTDHLNLSALRNIDRSTDNKVDTFLRDEAVSNIRTLHRFYERPQEELLYTAAFLDRFIARVKVKPKYIACVATACFLISMKIHSDQLNTNLLDRHTTPSASTLANMVRFGGTGSDLDRMQEIIISKAIPLKQPVVIEFLKLFNSRIDLPILYTLEAAIFSVNFYCNRPSGIALALCRIHKTVPDHMLSCFMQLCMISQTELTICESFLRKSEQRFRDNTWRTPVSGMWPGLMMDRRRRSPMKCQRKASFIPMYACPDLTVEEEQVAVAVSQQSCPVEVDTGDASSFLLALSLDRSFPGVELTYHQQCPVVRILWRSQLQNWHPKNGEHPFVFLLWNQMTGKRLVSPEETRAMFQRALLTDENVRERIDYPSNRPEEHRIFEFCPKTLSETMWEARVCKTASALGFEPPSYRSLHSLLAEVKTYQTNQREIHNRNHSMKCEVPFLKRFSSKSVSSCRKFYDRKSKQTTKHLIVKQDSQKLPKKKYDGEGRILDTIFRISKSSSSESRGLMTQTNGVLNSGAKDTTISSACGFAELNESYQNYYPLSKVIEA